MGHRETDFRRWFSCKPDTCHSYQIDPKSDRFEPWGIIDRKMLLQHPYDEVYRGYGESLTGSHTCAQYWPVLPMGTVLNTKKHVISQVHEADSPVPTRHQWCSPSCQPCHSNVGHNMR